MKLCKNNEANNMIDGKKKELSRIRNSFINIIRSLEFPL